LPALCVRARAGCGSVAVGPCQCQRRTEPRPVPFFSSQLRLKYFGGRLEDLRGDIGSAVSRDAPAFLNMGNIVDGARCGGSSAQAVVLRSKRWTVGWTLDLSP